MRDQSVTGAQIQHAAAVAGDMAAWVGVFAAEIVVLIILTAYILRRYAREDTHWSYRVGVGVSWCAPARCCETAAAVYRRVRHGVPPCAAPPGAP